MERIELVMSGFIKGLSVSTGIGAGFGAACYLLFLVLECLPESAMKGLQFAGGACQVYSGVTNMLQALE